MASAAAPGRSRLLVIDDNPSLHADFRKILADDGVSAPSDAELALFGESAPVATRPTFDLDFASQGREGLAKLEAALREQRPYALAFVDMRMPPGWDGLETIEHLWAADPHLQVVICSAHSDYDWLEVVARLGHNDKLLIVKKPFETIEILQCANALTQKWRNERELRQQTAMLEQMLAVRTQGLEAANRQLHHLATHDPLTGLPNRALLEDRLRQSIARAEQYGESFGVLLIDLDRFKVVNDSFGHSAGDELLQQVAQRLQQVIRQLDTVGRLGGDEFVAIVGPHSDADGTTQVAQRILHALQSPILARGVDVRITPSIGIALYPFDGKTHEALLAHADAAMYHAKQRGRNGLLLSGPKDRPALAIRDQRSCEPRLICRDWRRCGGKLISH